MTVDVDRYIAGAPTDQQPLLRELDEQIRRAFPEAGLDPKSYFPVYVVDGHWIAGYATRKKGAMFYCMDATLLDDLAGRLGRQRSGKTCIEYRTTKHLSLDALRAMVPDILARQARRLADGSGGFLPTF